MKKIISIILCLIAICSTMVCISYAENTITETVTDSSNTFAVTEMNLETGEESVKVFDKVNTFSIDNLHPFELPKNDTVSPRAVIGNNERVKVEDTTVYPYSAIVLLEIRWSAITVKHATAFMISENVAVTSAHALYKKEYDGWPISIKAYPAKDGLGLWNNPYGTTTSINIGVCTQYKELVDSSPYESQSYPQEDWGAVIFEDHIGEETGTISLKCPTDSELDSLINEKTVQLSGYPEDNQILPYYQYKSSGHILSYNNDFIFYTLDTAGGQSGSPILNENNKAIGIHQGGDENYNKAVRMDENMLYYFNLTVEDYKDL